MKAVAVAGVVLAAFFAPRTAAAADPVWGDAFSTRSAAASVHWRATYKDDRGGDHSLEVWRDGDRRLKRETDGRLALLVERQPNTEYSYRLLDRARGIVIRVNRTNLHRIGVISDWTSLATSLSRPQGPYTLKLAEHPNEQTPVGLCRTFRLERAGRPAEDICWSYALGLPLRIRRGAVTLFAVESAERRALPAPDFALDARGLVEVDGDRDIDASRE